MGVAKLGCRVLCGSLRCSWEGFVYDWALLGVSLQGSGLAQALENRIQAGRGAPGSGIWTKPMVFESFSGSAKAIQGGPLRSFEVRWDVLEVPGVALGSAAGHRGSPCELLKSSWGGRKSPLEAFWLRLRNFGHVAN